MYEKKKKKAFEKLKFILANQRELSLKINHVILSK